VYYYYVKQFSRIGHLKQSRATVRVYRSNKRVQTIRIGAGSKFIGRRGRGHSWIPFRIHGTNEKVDTAVGARGIARVKLSLRARLGAAHHGTASGLATSAVTGRRIRGVKLRFRGPGVRRVVYTRITGKFRAPRLRNGKYTVTASKRGFVSYTEHFRVYGGRNTQKAILLSPRLKRGAMRFVLTWGMFPRDLDSYLQTPGGCTLYYRKKRCRGAHLDLDNVKGAGPETITISKLRRSGFYYYYVRQYSRLGRLEQSQAKLRVFTGNSYRTYKLGKFGKLQGPRGRGRTWMVLKIDGRTGKTVNGAKIPIKVGKPQHANTHRRRRKVWSRRRVVG